MKDLFFENLNILIVRDFWIVEIGPYFHKSIWVVIFVFLFFNFFVPKELFLKFLDGAISLWNLWVFLLGLPNQKMTLATQNTNFHIDLGRFVGDWTCIIQILQYSYILTTMSIWITLNNLVWTYKNCIFCHFWTIVLCTHLGAKLGKDSNYHIFGHNAWRFR